jgi:hypothetical protein
VFEALANGEMLFKNIPLDLLDSALCRQAIEYTCNPRYVFQRIPPHLMTHEIARAFVDRDCFNFYDLPDRYRTPELALLALTSVDVCEMGYIIGAIPPEIFTLEMYRVVMRRNPSRLNSLPLRFRTEQTYLEAIEVHCFLFHLVPKPFMDDLDFCRKAFRFAKQQLADPTSDNFNAPKRLNPFFDWVSAEILATLVSEKIISLDEHFECVNNKQGREKKAEIEAILADAALALAKPAAA